MRVVGSRRVWRLEEVTAAVAARFEGVREFWVEAEIDEFRRVGGQVYFQLRGAHVVDASMGAPAFERLVAVPAAGSRVHAFGRMEYYRPRSRISMRVELMELAGEGLLRARIEDLRRRLAQEGMLAAARKRRPPLLPRRVALVTSASGAAREDFMRNAEARFPGVAVTLFASPVQGESAPRTLAAAVRAAGRRRDIDVVVVTRGGGSLEDLMAFNSEPVCRAVAECAVPVVSAVGHERDWTLCDEVADMRVSTPTAAAAAVVPSREALEVRMADLRAAMARGVDRARAQAQADLTRRREALAVVLGGQSRAANVRAREARRRLVGGIRSCVAQVERQVAARDERASRALVALPARAAERVGSRAALLRTLSPDATVARGYAIVSDRQSGSVLVDGQRIAGGTAIYLRMRDGMVGARVEDL